MKKYIKIFVMLAVFSMVALTLYAAATGVTYNTTTRVSVGPKGSNYVLFSGQTPATVVGDSIGVMYTKAMYIADFNQTTYAYFMLDMYDATGTEDCDVTVEYSYDLTNWVVGSAASGVIKEQLTPAGVSDTLNVINLVSDTNFHVYPWMRLKFDYQTGNPTGTYVLWYIRMAKDADQRYPRKNSLIANSL